MPLNSPNTIASFTANKLLYESVQRFSVINLNDLIRVLMENIDDSLFELSDKATNNRDRTMYFEAMREIRKKRAQIKELFNHELEQKFNQLLQHKVKLKTIEDNNELSLLDQDELEDSLAIDNMISKARPHFEDELLAISERLKAILNRKNIADDQNPLDPKSICDSFHNASDILQLDINVKLIFYKLFDKFVMFNLGHFYTELNDFLIKKGVLVDFSAAEERANQTTQFMANRIRSNPDAKAEKEQLNQSLLQQNINTEQTAPISAEGSLLSLLQQMVAPISAQTASPTTNIPMVDMDVTSNGLNQPSINSNGLVGISPSAQNPVYISALTHLQTSEKTTESFDINADPETLKMHLQQQLSTFKHDNSHYSSTIDNQVIDIVSMIFDFFFDDKALPNPIKVLIGRLQIPILKVAIIDVSFFNSKKHPARQLLDSISKEALGWGHDSQKEYLLISKVEDIIDALLLNFDHDIAVFEKALNEFNAFITQNNDLRDDSIGSIIDVEQASDDKILHAQNMAAHLIDTHINQHEFSFDIIDFLQSTWKTVLYQTFLTQGEDSQHWKNIKHITSTLIWTLIVKKNEDEKKKLFKTLPALLRSLSKGLELIRMDEEGKNSVFQMLVKEHSKIVKLSNKCIVTRVNDETVWPAQNVQNAFKQSDDSNQNIDFNLANLNQTPNDDDSINAIEQADTNEVIQNLNTFTQSVAKGDIKIDEEIIMSSSPILQENIEANAEQDDFLDIAQSLEMGTWVEFKELNSDIIQGKLSWKSNVTGKCVFVNRHGEKIKTISSFALAIEFRSKCAAIMPPSSVFDRALSSLMSSIGR